MCGQTKWLHTLLIIVIISLVSGEIARAQKPSSSTQNEVIAKIIMELPRYVLLNATEKQSSSLCVPDDAEFYSYLLALNEKRRVFNHIHSTLDTTQSNCRYIYVGKTKLARQLLRSGYPRDSILISNYEAFINEGGAIAVVDNAGKIEIYLNLSTIEHQNADLSPDLIEVSKRVIQ
jgi:hypothetical protein